MCDIGETKNRITLYEKLKPLRRKIKKVNVSDSNRRTILEIIQKDMLDVVDILENDCKNEKKE